MNIELLAHLIYNLKLTDPVSIIILKLSTTCAKPVVHGGFDGYSSNPSLSHPSAANAAEGWDRGGYNNRVFPAMNDGVSEAI